MLAPTNVAATLLLFTTNAFPSQPFTNAQRSEEKIFGDGGAHTLGPSNDTSDLIHVRVQNGTTLSSKPDVTLRAGEDNVAATLYVLENSVLLLNGPNITIMGSNYTYNIGGEAYGGLSMAFFQGSTGIFNGPMSIVGGNGDEDSQDGNGGDALHVLNANTSVMINGATLIPGDGFARGKALVVQDDAEVTFQSGVVNGEVHIESGGVVSAYGGTFLQPVEVKGSGSQIKFYGCFSIDETEDGARVVSGSFANTENPDISTKPIIVNTYQGGEVFIEKAGTCGEYEADVPSQSPSTMGTTFFPTTFPTSEAKGNDTGFWNTKLSFAIILCYHLIFL